LAIAALLTSSALAHATSITYEGTRVGVSTTTPPGVDLGYHYDATATFTVSGNNLIVTLTNTATDDVLNPIEVLTGIFFHISDPVTLSKVSAQIPGGSSVLFAPVGGSGPAVGGEWAYKIGLNNYSLDRGISSSGMGIFGPSDRFPGANLQGPADPDGLQYGITAAGDNPATGNAPVKGSNALIKNSVVFTLAMDPNVAKLFDPSHEITGVVFQYGTALDEGHTVGECISGCLPPPPPPEVPEPGTIFFLSGALAALITVTLRWRETARQRA